MICILSLVLMAAGGCLVALLTKERKMQHDGRLLIHFIDEFYKKTRSEGFGDEVKRRIMVGSFMLSGKNVLEYYNKALRIRSS